MPASTPAPQGLYDGRTSTTPAVSPSSPTSTAGAPTRSSTDALTALHNLDHRGASGAEVNTGDGAGILVQVPDEFLREVVDFDLPQPGAYAVGHGVPAGRRRGQHKAVDAIERIAAEEDLRVLGWRDVPVDASIARRHRAVGHADVPAAVRRRVPRRDRDGARASRVLRCASGSSARSASTCRRCPAGPRSTRAC